MSKLLQLYIGGYGEMITVLHRGGYAQMITILHGGSLLTPKSDYVIFARPLIVNLPKFMNSISEYHPTMVTPSSPNRSLFIVSLQMK